MIICRQLDMAVTHAAGDPPLRCKSPVDLSVHVEIARRIRFVTAFAAGGTIVVHIAPPLLKKAIHIDTDCPRQRQRIDPGFVKPVDIGAAVVTVEINHTTG
jgi:hypothetical protein